MTRQLVRDDFRPDVSGLEDFITEHDGAVPIEDKFHRDNARLEAELLASEQKRRRADEKLRLAERELIRHREHLEELTDERAAALEAAQEDLLRNERLATLGRLVATVSHEIRNPLGTIQSSLFSLRERLGGRDEAADKALDRAERNVRRCDRIIEDLLSYTRKQPPRLAPTDIDGWLAEALDEIRIPAGVRFEKHLLSGATVLADHDRLRRCVVNVIDNAVQAMVPGACAGETTLTVETRTLEGRVEIRVADTGPGIPPDRFNKVFEPFYSTKPFGVGLGLPVVRQIMEQHSGGVVIENRDGGGARVTLWLPRLTLPREDALSHRRAATE